MTDPDITELVMRLDQQLSDLEEACDAAEAWIENHRSRERAELAGVLDGLERSIRSELCTLSSFVDDLPTSDTRARIVPPEEAS